ncbi:MULTISPECIES: TetR/AcrR family transcriptional regulator [unclassified Streptomyces]|uniref:TetR/AcrR family transcriptional regulator n=1 Tax=unclassified Streptomyces TaxID=2593676 RepID=UPI000BF90DF9|nr:TetR/AcrR family transcriptional regulator [Streptomyces sp. Ru87]PGH47336.1 TetR family transcriptional regulator [Streptomyces sp. Ru87]
MAGLRAVQKEMTRKLLLSTALELFQAKGYAATTVNDIAKAAETTRVTFYAYFQSRSDLARALIGELNEMLGRGESRRHGPTASALAAAVREGTHTSLANWLDERSRQWEAVRPYVNVTIEASLVDPELRGLADAWFEEVVADIEEGLGQAGRFAPATRRARAQLAFAQLHHAARNWAEGRWGLDRAELVAVLAESWAGVLTDGAERTGGAGRAGD